MTDADDSAPPTAPGTEPPAPEADAPTRPGRGRLWVTVTAFVVLATGAGIGAGLAWEALAVESTSSAAKELATASQKLSDATDARGVALDKAHASVSSLDEFLKHPRPDYLDEATAKALTDAETQLAKDSDKLAQARFVAPHLPAASADLLPWTVLADVQHKLALAREENTLRRTRAADQKRLDTAQKALDRSFAAVSNQLTAHGEQVLSAADSATYASRIVLRHAIDDSTSDAKDLESNGTGLLQIETAVDGVNAAQAAGEAAKQDPAYPVRAQIEQYARSIAHGVNLDFEWHKEVSGLGDGWYSGTTQYHEDDGGWATIDLNFSIQGGWSDGDVDAKALVTHEVGHSQVVRPACRALFDGPAFRDDDEMWATAWAISMGFDTGGSGIEAYGRPTDQQIAVAGQCR
ncbi:hypothetical protein [Leifsonia sp. SIMBA_070]|uniref:hypothetical protein n=1 Tax=Leifsonia sp. SIMBA_070 TaxID=3085810 RepID=UPI00397932B7